MRFEAVAVALVLMLAGCAQDKAPVPDEEDPLGDLQATEDTGVIKGVVVDDGVNPIAGASIVLTNGQNTTSNAQGLFGFDGLEPGVHFMTVSKLGYLTTQAQADVEAGVSNPRTINVQLQADPSTRPTYVEHYVQGYIACSFTLVLVSFAACGVGPVAELTENHFIDEVQFARVADFVQSEMVWRSTQTMGDSMSLSWTDPSSGSQVRINASSGESPVVVTFGRAEFEAMNLTDKDLWLRVFSTQREGTNVVPIGTVHGAWASNVYPTYNGTVPAAAKDAISDGVTQCVPFVGCTLDPIGEQCIRWVVLFDACMGAGGVGVTLEQSYEIFTTSFYGYKPPAGWMFTTDGPFPPPE